MDNPNEPVGEDTVLQAESDLLDLAKDHAIAPPSALRNKVLDKIWLLNSQKKEQRKLDIENLPLLDESSNWLEWKEVTASIAPPDDFEDIYMHTLESNENRDLFVAWVKEFVPEEVHHDLLESVLILEGACTCFITGPDGNTRSVWLGEGDFFTMQTGEHHDIHITSSMPAMAIIQWKKLAA